MVRAGTARHGRKGENAGETQGFTRDSVGLNLLTAAAIVRSFAGRLYDKMGIKKIFVAGAAALLAIAVLGVRNKKGKVCL